MKLPSLNRAATIARRAVTLTRQGRVLLDGVGELAAATVRVLDRLAGTEPKGDLPEPRREVAPHARPS